MKKIITIIISVLLTTTLSAQKRIESYKIKFTDKGESINKLSSPQHYLSERSLERRLMQQIPLDESDLPVNEHYLIKLRELGAEVYYTSKWLNVALVHLNQNQVGKISQLPFVKSIQRINAYDSKLEYTICKDYFKEENLQKIDISKLPTKKSTIVGLDYGPSANQAQMLKIDQLHNQGYTGNGIVIAVIDAGFNSVDQMAVFDSLRAQNKILGTRDFVQPGNNVYGGGMSTHGTSVLSTMGGNLPGQIIGTAPHASYYLFRSEDVSDEYLMEEYYWVQAAEYADSLGVDILSTSLGYTVFYDSIGNHTYSDMDGNTTVITIGADLAAKKGMLVVNSAGNNGNESWRYISAPADGDSVLTIGAVNASGIYASFSSTGPTYDGRIKPDVAAQGKSTIVAVVPTGIAAGDGTSFSAPIISGAAACLWQANQSYSNMEIYNAIKQSGSRASNPDNFIGWGIPDFITANSLLVGNIDKINYSQEISCYPNPFNDFIIAEFNLSSTADTKVRFINYQGQVVRSVNSINLNHGFNKIMFDNLETLPKGVYFIQISGSYGTLTQKIIK